MTTTQISKLNVNVIKSAGIFICELRSYSTHGIISVLVNLGYNMDFLLSCGFSYEQINDSLMLISLS